MPVTISGSTGIGTPGLTSETMPTSDGAPIVESGSNSDGDWTRWADGTQHTLRMEAIGSGVIGVSGRYNSPTFAHPMPYLNGTNLSGYVVVRSSYPDRVAGGIEQGTTTATMYGYAIENNHGAQITDLSHGARFTGRWK